MTGPPTSRPVPRTTARPAHRPSFPAAPGWLTVPLAHRGLHTPDGPQENTLDAFAAARDAGVGVELDVHVSADGVPVVHHDLTLADGRPIGRVAAADLPAHVPTLADALDLLTAVPVMVELKQAALRVGALERATARVLDGHRGPHCIASFRPETVAWFARHRPATVRVFTVTDQPDAPTPAPLRRWLARLGPVRWLRPHALSVDVRDLPTPASVAWREQGGTVTTWTVRDAATRATARTHADGLIFEHVDPYG